MQRDFHYYATYCAAVIAGYPHEEACDICWSAYHVDKCTRSFIASVDGPFTATTTQSKGELTNIEMDKAGVHEITRIWSSFHFLPKNLYPTFDAWRSKRYKDAYALICGPNSDLVAKTVERAKGEGLQATGIAMHVLADTWAHANFAGTPTLVINNRDDKFTEILSDGQERPLTFTLRAALGDNTEESKYISSLYQDEEHSMMNLGHGRVGHLPDYSFIRFRYRPAWNGGEYIVKDNPADYGRAFRQVVYAMKYLRGEIPSFELDTYADEEVAPWSERIDQIIRKRVLNNCEEWKAFGEELSGQIIPDYEQALHSQEYLESDDKENTFLGKYFAATRGQKRMVSSEINDAGISLAGKRDEIYWLDISSEISLLDRLTRMVGLKEGDEQ